MIDKEISDDDFETFKTTPNNSDEESVSKEQVEEFLKCDYCGKTFKTKHGLNIHKSKLHNSDHIIRM